MQKVDPDDGRGLVASPRISSGTSEQGFRQFGQQDGREEPFHRVQPESCPLQFGNSTPRIHDLGDGAEQHGGRVAH